jgi:hypothetical protein
MFETNGVRGGGGEGKRRRGGIQKKKLKDYGINYLYQLACKG